MKVLASISHKHCLRFKIPVLLNEYLSPANQLSNNCYDQIFYF